MARRISNCSISLLLCCLLSLPAFGQSIQSSANRANSPEQKKEKKEPKKLEPTEMEYPLYNGVSVGVDLWGVGSKLLGGENLSAEVCVNVNLYNRFLPTAEIGYAQSNADGDIGTRYKTQAPYFRIGLDYNALYKRKHGHMITVGLRYGVTNFKYDIEAIGLDDPIYGGTVGNPNLEDDIWGGSLPYNQPGMKGSMQWIEVCTGLRARITPSLYMGWAIRFKYKLSATTGQYGDPWYVPGYGKYGSSTIGVTYTITYKLPF